MFVQTILAFAGLAAASAIPAARLIPRSSVAPAASSVVPAPSSIAIVDTAPVSVVVPAKVSTVAPPVPTWSVVTEIGDSTFSIGDADPTTFLGLWEPVCGDNGCDAGSPVTINFNTVEAGIKIAGSGTFTLSGNINDNQALTTNLLNVTNTAMLASKQCTVVQGESASEKRKRETPGIAVGTAGQSESITQCTVVNYIQATIYDTNNDQQGQITMSAVDAPDPFDCSDMISVISGAVTALDLLPPVQGAAAIAGVLCNAISGES